MQSSPKGAAPRKQLFLDVKTDLAGIDGVSAHAGTSIMGAVQPPAASAVGPGVQPAFKQERKAEMQACDTKAAGDQTTEEFSFEELRAAKWLAQHKKQVAQLLLLNSKACFTQKMRPCQMQFIDSVIKHHCYRRQARNDIVLGIGC